MKYKMYMDMHTPADLKDAQDFYEALQLVYASEGQEAVADYLSTCFKHNYELYADVLLYDLMMRNRNGV